MTAEDFQKYYDSNSYPDSIYPDFYYEMTPETNQIPRDIFWSAFRGYLSLVDAQKVLMNIIKYYVEKFKIRQRYPVFLLAKDGTRIKRLEDILDRE